jgi:hypothetical protein
MEPKNAYLEPWVEPTNPDDPASIRDADGAPIAGPGTEHPDRIVACVNKLVGHADLSQVEVIPTHVLAEVRGLLRAELKDMNQECLTAQAYRAALAKLGKG